MTAPSSKRARQAVYDLLSHAKVFERQPGRVLSSDHFWKMSVEALREIGSLLERGKMKPAPPPSSSKDDHEDDKLLCDCASRLASMLSIEPDASEADGSLDEAANEEPNDSDYIPDKVLLKLMNSSKAYPMKKKLALHGLQCYGQELLESRKTIEKHVQSGVQASERHQFAEDANQNFHKRTREMDSDLDNHRFGRQDLPRQQQILEEYRQQMERQDAEVDT